ncbi:MAG: hypothetical protein Greene041679_273 [Parcubacteria group bacterium Greene0416_79]|nr:MAG: hypothetical protein Greene041679_273 [Parcubacteria group bacterium Greene0416_79]
MLTLERKLHMRVRTAARELGLPEREVLNRAVSSYLLELEEWQLLKEELRMWDVLSAKALTKYKL